MVAIALSVAYKALSFGGNVASLSVVSDDWNTELQHSERVHSNHKNFFSSRR